MLKKKTKKNLKQKFEVFGAKDEARTRDNQLGRLELYQLSYFRINNGANIINKFASMQVFFKKITNLSPRPSVLKNIKFIKNLI